jgi:hypothetical protein
MAAAQAQTLSGQVSSEAEGMMEGVLVSAKKDGSTITTTVVSNDKGQFSFPAGKLEPGKYNITIRAAGYTLAGPKTVDVAAAGATADVKLNKARNIAPQLSNGEWLASIPGEDRFKASFLLDCQGCHSLQRVFTASYNADEWKQVFTRMGRTRPRAFPSAAHCAGGLRSGGRVAANMMDQARFWKVSIANSGRVETPRTFPRRRARPQVVITEYDLPRKEALPHDVVVDADGHAWYTDFEAQFVGDGPRPARSPIMRSVCDPSSQKSLDLELIRTATSGSDCRIRAARSRSTARASRSPPIR